MKLLVQTIFLVSFFLLLPLSTHGADQKTPLEIAGFTLGSNVADYTNIEYTNFLKEVIINDWRGFRKGIISYAICDSPGEIVKIRLKYNDPSTKFYKTLLKRYQAKFGEPDEWKGDAFGTHYIWKWKFVDESGNAVHLLLKHNRRNPNENIGNMLSLYFPDKIEKERACFNKQCASNLEMEGWGNKEERMKHSWDDLIPR